MKSMTQLEEMAKEHGLEFAKKTHYHFHLKGVFLLNVYPTKETYYIQGTNGGIPYRSLQELVMVAKGEKNVAMVTDKTPRRKNRKDRERMYFESNTCFVCGGIIKTFEDSTVEHKIPLSRGGSNRPDNLALSHYQCNKDRGSNLSVKRNP